MTRPRILVAGAGPAGAALSLLLARRGVEVVLVEREASFERVFRGEALMPSGLDALRQLGLGAALDALPQIAVPCMELYVEGERILRADWPELAGPNAARAVSQPALIGLLVERAAAAGACELRAGTSVVGLDMAPSHVNVTLRSATGQTTLRADAIVGADGRSSTVRALAGLKLRRSEFPGHVAWLSLPAPETQRTDPRFQAFRRGDQSVILYPSWDGRIRVGVNLIAGETDSRKEQLLDRIATVAGEPWAAIAREQADQVSEPVVLKVLVGRVPQWSTGRLLLLGDAAHPMAPVRAQGINLALRDAIVAANHLVPALAAGGDEAFAAAGARVQQEREPEVAAIQRLQLEAMRLPPPARSPLLRSTLLPVLRGVGLMKRMMLSSERPLRHGTAEVRLTV